MYKKATRDRCGKGRSIIENNNNAVFVHTIVV